MTILEQIVAARHEAVAAAQSTLSLAACRKAALATAHVARDFYGALQSPAGVRIIAEVKRASPSKGVIAPDLDAAATAVSYAAGGAVALSVLTENAFFHGTAADLRAARAAVALPVLRKDFIVAPYQLYESVLMGADAVLLIVRILDDRTLGELHTLAHELGLAVLTEVFTESDVARANAIGARLIGINNRDLTSFATDATHATRLARQVWAGATVVALSGIASDDDVRRTLEAGIRCFLVGESLLRTPDPAALLRRWIGLHGG